MAKSTLRAVGADEKPPPKSITEAADKGTQRELLVAMRARIAKTVEDPKCPPRDLASLSRRLMELAREIEQIDIAAEEEGGTSGQPSADEALDASAI